MVNGKIPEFVKLRGCINCDASKALKERTGRAYGFDHQLVARCVLLGCREYGHDLTNPFMDPEEVINFSNRDPQPQARERVRAYCLKIKEQFGRFYEAIGVSIDDLLVKLS